MASFFNNILTALDFTTGKLCSAAAVTALLYVIALSEKSIHMVAQHKPRVRSFINRWMCTFSVNKIK